MINRLALLIFVFVIFFHSTEAKDSNLNRDSLLQVLQTLDQDEATNLIKTTFVSALSDTSAIFFLADLIEKQNGTEKQLLMNKVSALSMRGFALNKMGKDVASIRLSEQSLEILDTVQQLSLPTEALFKEVIAMKSGIHLNCGINYNSLGKKEKALNHLEKAMQYAEQQENLPYQQKALTSMGNIFMRVGDYTTAIDYFLQALDVAGEKETAFTAETNRSLGSIYIQKKNNLLLHWIIIPKG